MWFAGERGERGSDLGQVGAHVGGSGAGVAVAVVTTTSSAPEPDLRTVPIKLSAAGAELRVSQILAGKVPRVATWALSALETALGDVQNLMDHHPKAKDPGRSRPVVTERQRHEIVDPVTAGFGSRGAPASA